ncbi:MAG: pentapeptide repeat-containing protein [Cyanobacteria bacterium J06632_22]
MKWRPQRSIHHLEERLKSIPTWLVVGVSVVFLALVIICVDKDIEKEIDSLPDALSSPKVLTRVLMDDAESIAIVVAVILYIKGAPDRRAQKHYEAWRVIDLAAASGVPKSFARNRALQDLLADGVSLSGIDAPGANLSGIELAGADLSNSNLRGANLEKADLRRANLEKADLQGANLESAQLTEATLDDANLQQTNLRYSEMWRVSLIDADLSQAELRWAEIGEEELINAKLNETVMPDGSKRG